MAQTNILINQPGHSSIDNIELDCLLHADHQYQNTITDYPVEEGYNINDHVVHMPEQVTLEVLISNTPVSLGVPTENIVYKRLRDLLDIGGFDSPEAQIQSSIKPAKLVSIVTGLRAYTKMGLTRLSIPEECKTANALKFTADFKRLRIVNTETVIIENTSELMGKAPNIKNQASKTKDAGKQGTKETEDKGSLITQLSDLMKNFAK